MIVRWKKVDKEFLKKRTSILIDENFESVAPFYPSSSGFFSEFVQKLHEVNTCIILECHFATITLTNHILERLLKVALVFNETGIERVRSSKLNEHYSEAHEKYQGASLSKTINQSCSAGLITKEHKKYLSREVLDKLRNGYSHSDPNKIIKGKNGQEVYVTKENKTDLKLDPFLQSQIMTNLAQQEAFPYYKYVFELIYHIEKILIEKEKTRPKR